MARGIRHGNGVMLAMDVIVRLVVGGRSDTAGMVGFKGD